MCIVCFDEGQHSIMVCFQSHLQALMEYLGIFVRDTQRL